MNIRNIYLQLFLQFPLVLLASGCDPELCVKDSLQGDTQYRFTFVELYNENAIQTQWDPDIIDFYPELCDRLSLATMTQFTATTKNKESLDYPNSCTAWQLQIDDFDNADNVGDIGRGVSGSSYTSYSSFASGRADIAIDGCSSEWVISVLATNTFDPFGPAKSDKPPPLLIRREIRIHQNDDCGDTRYSCHEYWAATVERVE